MRINDTKITHVFKVNSIGSSIDDTFIWTLQAQYLSVQLARLL